MHNQEEQGRLLRDEEKDNFELGDLTQHVQLDDNHHNLQGKMIYWPRALQALQHILFFLLPSPIQNLVRPKDVNVKKKKLHPTAFLDGMRGLACLFVYVFHISHSCHQVFAAYGSSDNPEEDREFLKLPLIRVIYTGSGMVAIFFVISGYALSYRPVELMRSGKYGDLFRNLSSAAFRRGFRLFLPCVASSFLIALAAYIGLYDWTREIANDTNRLTHVQETHPESFPTLSGQLFDWFKQMLRFLNPWVMDAGSNATHYDVHLWTIPYEYRTSIMLFATQLAIGRFRTVPRNLFLLSCIAWSFYQDKRVVQLFYWGFFLAELDFARKATTAAATPMLDVIPSRSSAYKRQAWNTLYTISFFAALYLAGQPPYHISKSPGWITLSKLIPEGQDGGNYWTNWGAILLVWSTSRAPFLQPIFTNRFSQYMGYISFAFYLMHGPVTHTVGYATMDYMWTNFGMDPWSVKEVGFGVAFVVTLGVTMWVADIFTRAVDQPVVRFARWLETRCLYKEMEKNHGCFD